MAIDNLISISFSDTEIKKINDAIKQLNEVLSNKAINLSPDERKQYGSIADRNKILVDKCKDYMDNNPDTLPRTLDKTEFDADYQARKQIEMPLRALAQIMEKLSDTKILLDHDNYHSSVGYYRYIKYLASQNEPGTTSIYQDLRKHYQNSGAVSQNNSENPSDTNNTTE